MLQIKQFSLMQKRLREMEEMPVVLRKATYKGIGRPRKSDYVTVKRKDILDFIAFEIYNNGFEGNVYP